MQAEKIVLRQGRGPKPHVGAIVTIDITGFGKDGDLSQKFWSSKDPGKEPFTFKLGVGMVVKVWDECVLEMKFGEVAKLTCSSDYAFGDGGFTSGIKPNSTLVFEIELLEVCEVKQELKLSLPCPTDDLHSHPNQFSNSPIEEKVAGSSEEARMNRLEVEDGNRKVVNNKKKKKRSK